MTFSLLGGGEVTTWLTPKAKHILYSFGKNKKEHGQQHCRFTSGSSSLVHLVTNNRHTVGSFTYRVLVLVSCCCCNKWPQIYRLKTTQIYYLTVLEVRSLKWISLGKHQGVSRAVSLLETWGENLFPCLFQLLEAAAFFVSWSLSNFKDSHHIPLTSASIVTIPFSDSESPVTLVITLDPLG